MTVEGKVKGGVRQRVIIGTLAKFRKWTDSNVDGERVMMVHWCIDGCSQEEEAG